jgi:predicted nuclease of predicted toxin-antitoxin system
MKLLLDANLPPQAAARLQDLYPGSLHVRALGMRASSDTDIWAYAKREGFVIMSKDSDFYNRSVLLEFPPKVIWLKLGNCSNTELEMAARQAFHRIMAFEQDDTAASLIVL